VKEAKTPDNQSRLLKVGLIGTVIAALCCFTPVLVILFGAVGLSAMLGWLDYVLLPALAVFIGITVYALWKIRNSETPS
jgi:mercuric ion transport protein